MFFSGLETPTKTSTKLPPNFHQTSIKLPPNFHHTFFKVTFNNNRTSTKFLKNSIRQLFTLRVYFDIVVCYFMSRECIPERSDFEMIFSRLDFKSLRRETTICFFCLVYFLHVSLLKFLCRTQLVLLSYRIVKFQFA